MTNSGEEETIADAEGENHTRFLQLFERIRVEFPKEEYPHVDWQKAKCEQGSTFDAFEIVRAYSQEVKEKQSSIPVKLIFHLENNPKKYRLSA